MNIFDDSIIYNVTFNYGLTTAGLESPANSKEL